VIHVGHLNHAGIDLNPTGIGVNHAGIPASIPPVLIRITPVFVLNHAGICIESRRYLNHAGY
jgi:hypothetical protein